MDGCSYTSNGHDSTRNVCTNWNCFWQRVISDNKTTLFKKLLYSIASLLLIANTINIGADIGAMGASLKLLIPQVPFFISTLIFTGIILSAEIFISYKTYSKVLKDLTLSLFLYVVTAFLGCT